ncbi:MAG TPA: bifunctional pyr operon transcriptional regulator/uracil phosphoribosyltransferase PyrR [Methylotenera sp.]|nr:bifunctional pyr operon transcriptional regulator/uracil phosphoribosyltransferase PyrR [Methylotenera sp.]
MQLPNPETLLTDITAQIAARINPNTALVGIHSGGVWLMQRILKTLKQDFPQYALQSGTLDAALYRDDYAARGLKTDPKPSDIAFDVADKHIILIDDIFYTGRTTRAAMNELFDYGRPASITLSVLINRGGAQLPIIPNITGAEILLQANQNLQLSQDTKGKLHLEIEHNV